VVIMMAPVSVCHQVSTTGSARRRWRCGTTATPSGWSARRAGRRQVTKVPGRTGRRSLGSRSSLWSA